MPDVTYYVALPFMKNEDGYVGGQAVECPSGHSAIGRALSLAARPENSGALAFARTGDPNAGEFRDAEVLGRFGDVPADLSDL